MASATEFSTELPTLSFKSAPALSAPASVAGKPVRSSKRDGELSLLMQFDDPFSQRSQVLSFCHLFAAVAIVEAAYFRQHGRTIHLAEADLFIQRKLLSDHIADAIFQFGGFQPIAPALLDLSENVNFMLDHGVGKSLPYDAFLKRYQKYTAKDDRSLWGDLGLKFQRMGRVNPTHRVWILGALERLMSGGKAPVAKCAAERAELKGKLKGFKLAYKVFVPGPLASPRSQAEKLAAGLDQKRFLLSELDRERPVAVGMNVTGLTNWNAGDYRFLAGHNFVIVGYGKAADGKYVFHSRNSWGGDHPHVFEEDLYRIMEMASVRTPGER